MKNRKILGIKNYGSIPHLPGSRTGPGDHTCHEGQARIATSKARDRHDLVIVQEKLDGSNVGVARIGEEIYPISRAGYMANTSPYIQHHLFYRWAYDNKERFMSILRDGERLVGEWMLQAHGTLYDLENLSLFAPFDLMTGHKRVAYHEFVERIKPGNFEPPPTIHIGEPMCIEDAMSALGSHGYYGALDQVEGAVWRIERRGKVDFLVKYVRPDKMDGTYLGEENEPVWNITRDVPYEWLI